MFDVLGRSNVYGLNLVDFGDFGKGLARFIACRNSLCYNELWALSRGALTAQLSKLSRGVLGAQQC